MIKRLLLCLILIMSLSACSFLDNLPFIGGSSSSQEEIPPEPEPDPEFPISLAGAELKSRPGKIVSLAPSLTEKLYDLRMADRLVGVSDYCDYPAAAQSLPTCGDMLIPDLEALRELRPHLILTAAPLPEDALIALQQMDVEVAVLPHATSLRELMGIYEKIAMLLEGQTTGGRMGEAFTRNFMSRLDGLTRAVAPFREGEVKRALYLRYLDFTVATGDTLEHDLMGVIGLQNIAEDYADWLYPASSAQSESGRADFMAVGVIFCDERDVAIKMLEESEFYKGLPAVLGDQYLYIDATVFERQSLRIVDQLTLMAEYCYPEMSQAAEDKMDDIVDEDEEDDEDEDGNS